MTSDLPFRRYVFLFFLISTLLVSSVGLFNLLIDPYGNLGFNRLGVFIGVERDLKPYQIQHYPHDAVIIGNSLQGVMDPDKIVSSYRFYNAYLAGARSEELRTFIERYVHNQRLVLVALDFGAVIDHNTPYIENPIPDSFYDRFISRIFNLRTVEYSIRTLRLHAKGKTPTYKENGAGWGSLEDSYAEESRAKDYEYKSVLELAKRNYNRAQVDPKRMNEIRRIKQILEERKIPYIIFSNPIQEKLWEEFIKSNSYPQYLQWGREIREIFPDFIDFTSNGSFSATTNFWKLNAGHYRPEIGYAMLEIMLRDHDPNQAKTPPPAPPAQP
jgi:hypothetical protein